MLLHRRLTQAVLEPPAGAAVDVYAITLADHRADRDRHRMSLSASEHQRAKRLTHAATREQFIITRGILRNLLGRLLGLTPAAVPLGVGSSGKPMLTGGAYEFNLAHSGGRALIAFSCRPVGIDLETIRPIPTMAGLVRRYFAPAEWEQYQTLPEILQPAAFFRAWCCKEALVKRDGVGLSGLHRYCVELDPRLRPGVVAGQPTPLAVWHPWPGTVAAVAVQ